MKIGRKKIHKQIFSEDLVLAVAIYWLFVLYASLCILGVAILPSKYEFISFLSALSEVLPNDNKLEVLSIFSTNQISSFHSNLKSNNKLSCEVTIN